MTIINNDNEMFREAADKLNPQPKNSSWDRLETMLENNSLVQENNNLQVENKSYKNKMRWLSGIAASLLVVGMSSMFLVGSEISQEPLAKQVAYSTETIELQNAESHHIYDIDKLSILNDAELWVNIVEGGPELKARKM